MTRAIPTEHFSRLAEEKWCKKKGFVVTDSIQYCLKIFEKYYIECENKLWQVHGPDHLKSDVDYHMSATVALMRNHMLSKQVLWRNFALERCPPRHGFTFFPQFFSRKEQNLLLSASLKVLDSLDTRLTRRRRADFFKSKPLQSSDTADPMELFAPEDLYPFQEVSLNLKAEYTYSDSLCLLHQCRDITMELFIIFERLIYPLGLWTISRVWKPQLNVCTPYVRPRIFKLIYYIWHLTVISFHMWITSLQVGVG